MADIKHITLPTGTTYDIVDQGARDLIDALSGYTVFLGVTTTPLSDGATTNPISINGASVEATAGCIATYGSAEFIWNGSAWQEFGDLSGLGDLAFKDNVTASYTPAGSVSQPTFTGTAATISSTYTPVGSVSQHTFTGTQATISTTYTPKGDVGISVASTGTANYTPAGNVSLTAPTVTLSTTTGKFITGAGTLPSATMPVLTTSVANETLTIGWTAGTWSAGALPTMSSDTTVATGVSNVSAGTASFTGTGVRLNGAFSGTQETISSTYTPAGSVSQPTFSGTEATISSSYTPAGTVSKPTFSGTQATITSS